MQGPSVAFLKGEEGILISLLAQKKAIIGWTYYVFALSPNNKTIYQFKSELVSSELAIANSLSQDILFPTESSPLTDQKFIKGCIVLGCAT